MGHEIEELLIKTSRDSPKVSNRDILFLPFIQPNSNLHQRLNISLHHSKAKENREILKVLINGTCYLANQELTFRGNDENATSFNRGNYVEPAYAFAENDEKTFRHLETFTVFSGLSNRIQNDIPHVLMYKSNF